MRKIWSWIEKWDVVLIYGIIFIPYAIVTKQWPLLLVAVIGCFGFLIAALFVEEAEGQLSLIKAQREVIVEYEKQLDWYREKLLDLLPPEVRQKVEAAKGRVH